GGPATRACCVVILDKGKPVVRPGRKARERTGRAVGASPATEGMLLGLHDAAIASGPPRVVAHAKTRRSLLERFGEPRDPRRLPSHGDVRGAARSNQPPEATKGFRQPVGRVTRPRKVACAAREPEDAMKNLAQK